MTKGIDTNPSAQTQHSRILASFYMSASFLFQTSILPGGRNLTQANLEFYHQSLHNKHKLVYHAEPRLCAWEIMVVVR